MISIAVVEEKDFKRESYTLSLNQFKKFNVVIQAKNKEELQTQLAHTAVDIVVYCWNSSFESDFEPLDQLQTAFPTIKMLLFATTFESKDLYKVMQRKFFGYLNEDATSIKLKKAIVSLQNKGCFFEPQVLYQWKAEFDSKQVATSYKKPLIIKLTTRERILIADFFSEMSMEEISNKHCISITTVNTHRRNILKKTNSKKIVGALRVIITNQILTLKQLGFHCLLGYCLLGNGIDYSDDSNTDEPDGIMDNYELLAAS